MYQLKYNIPATGIVDSKTRDTLNATISPADPLPPATTPPPVTPPKTTLQWGAYVGDSENNLATFESLVGKPVNIQSVFIGWGDSFPFSTASNLKSSGKTLLIFWEQYGTTVDSINAGNSDAYIAKFAQDAKTSGASIILAPLHEMNGNWDPWDGTVGNNTPAKVVTEWKRIHDAFSGVSNVKFAWDVNNESVPNTAVNTISAYYPGDTYVDYVAVDGFNFGNPWQSFDTVFAGVLSQLQTYHKPIYILSMAAVPDTRKAAWITDALTVQIPKYPAVAGWVWFNQNGADGNWLVNSDPASLVAFQAAVK
jgi:beta-mannanase